MKISLTTWMAMLVLSLSSFAIVTTELAPIGLMSSLAHDLQQTETRIGWILTGYGWLAAAAALFSLFLFPQLSRKRLLIILMLMLAGSSFVVASSQNFNSILLARALGALAHGAFWAMIGGAVYHLVPKEKLGLAMSVVFSGVSVASALGVPLSSFLNQIFGWRVVFILIAVLALICALLILLVVPKITIQSTPQSKAQWKSLMDILKNTKLKYLFALTSILIVSHFAAYSFIEPYLTQTLQLQGQKLVLFLLCFGLLGFAANIIIGAWIDLYLTRIVSIAIGCVSLSLFGLAYASQIGGQSMALASLSLWGASIAILFVALQTWVLSTAQTNATAASAIYVAVFNASIGFGALLGGQLLQRLSFQSTFMLIAVLLSSSLILVYRIMQISTARVISST